MLDMYRYLSEKFQMTTLRLLITIFFSSLFGVLVAITYIEYTAPPIVHRNNATVFRYENTFGIYIDRTRTSWCPVTSARIFTTQGLLNGKPFNMTYPLYTQDFIWPVLGRQVFGIIFDPNSLAKLPDGHWDLISTYYSSGCHWYSTLVRPKIQIQTAIGFDIKDGQLLAPNMLTVEPFK